jgi:hypothetical protein
VKRKPIAPFPDAAWSHKFHVWHMDWDENRIVISVDGEVLNDSDVNKAANPNGTNGYRQPHYMILNLAIGGLRRGPVRNRISGTIRNRLRADLPKAVSSA